MKGRVGKVVADKVILESVPGFLDKYLSDFQIFMKRKGKLDTVEFTGIHPEFDEVEVAISNAPEYSFTWHTNVDGTLTRECIK